jgi:large subunit ribosomal protein L20
MRVKRGTVARSRRKKVLERASGYYSSASRLFTVAKEVNDRALVFAYRDRKVKKREFRKLWIQRINAATRLSDMSYSKFMGGLKTLGLDLDRKVLADMAVADAASFATLVEKVKSLKA